jgi:hypothetical protein
MAQHRAIPIFMFNSLTFATKRWQAQMNNTFFHTGKVMREKETATFFNDAAFQAA